MPKPLHDVNPSERANSRAREPIMHRTAPEVTPMVAGRATGWGTGRGTAIGVAMFVVGLAVALGALIALGARVFPAFDAARDSGADPATVFFMGASGSVAELVLVIGLIVLVPVGIVLGWLGYGRITDDGPSLAALHQSNSPNAIINDLGSGQG